MPTPTPQQERRRRRLIGTTVVIAIAAALIAIMVIFGPKPPPAKTGMVEAEPAATDTGESRTEPAEASKDAGERGASADPSPQDSITEATSTGEASEKASVEARQASESAAPAAPPGAFRAAAPPGTGIVGHDTPPQSLGSLDPATDRMLVEFSRTGAGIASITLSDMWRTAAAKVRAREHYAAIGRGKPAPPLPDDDLRLVLASAQSLGFLDANNQYQTTTVPALAGQLIWIDGQPVSLFDYSINAAGAKEFTWAETAPGAFVTQVVDERDQPILRIQRSYTLTPNGYGLSVRQQVESLVDRPLQIRWQQYGPSDLKLDDSPFMDMRRFRFGYLWSGVGGPTANLVHSDDNDLLVERLEIIKRHGKWQNATDPAVRSELISIWPNETSRAESYELSWFAATNRYFALAVHPILNDPINDAHTFETVVNRIEWQVDPALQDKGTIHTNLFSPMRTLDPRGTTSFNLGVYAGPQDADILEHQQPYAALNMVGLIKYVMSSMCAFCTFQWLAHLLLWFLSIVHAVVFDWGVAIIMLVCVVRLILHPITKKSQISLQRFGRVMQKIKPDIDKLREKYGSDPKRMQQEQMKLMREHGVSPFGCLGILPMLMQTPIWFALYAMLFFAFELRQEPAFWGLFQLFGGWPFLADLSSPDRFITIFPNPVTLNLWLFRFDYSSINILPVLMGMMFFLQQKYMTPTSPNTSPEMQQQQKIMKVMIVVLFPLMMYSVPSGLTLYIMTSSMIGIIESRYIRRHIDEMDLEPKPKPKPAAAKGTIRNPQARAMAEMIERRMSQAQERDRGPQRTFKKRDR